MIFFLSAFHIIPVLFLWNILQILFVAYILLDFLPYLLGDIFKFNI